MFGVIGGSGFYDLDELTVTGKRAVSTPYGAPSAALTFARCGENEVVFLPRHGEAHGLLPSEINYRANIWALKEAGVLQLVAVSAVGSLRQEIAPGHFAAPAQYIDFTKGERARTFFGGGLVAHVSTARPACPALSAALARTAEECGETLHAGKTYACVEGPRLGTRGESFFLRDGAGADLVGMTNVPEAFLAREAQISYATLAVVTDYDCWQDDAAHHASAEEIIRRFGGSIARAKEIVKRLLRAPPPVDDAHRRVLASSVLTPAAAQSEAHRALLAILER